MMISALDSAPEYASSASEFRVMKVSPHVNLERIFKAFDFSPRMYRQAANASAVLSLVGFPKFTGLAATK